MEVLNMPISEEKMMILKMLQEGRINSDEAAKLLEALEEKEKDSSRGTRFSRSRTSKSEGHNYFDEVARVRERINEWRREIAKNYNQKDFDKMVDELSAKAEKFGKNLTTAAFGVADKVVDFVGSIIDTGAFNIFGNCVLVEKTYEADAAAGANLELQAANGPIVVKKHDEDKIIIRAKIRTPQENAESALVFVNEDGNVSLKLAKPDTYNLSVSYDVSVPAVKFDKLLLETKNSKICVEDTLSGDFSGVTKNGTIDLTGVTSDKITVGTKNAKVIANYLVGRDIKIGTSNGAIDIKNLKTEKIEASTINGKILLDNLQIYENANEAGLVLKTRNADIKANMNDSEDNGYKIEARTVNGGVNLLIPNLLYRNVPRDVGSGRLTEAETENYSTAAQKINIYAETQNGYIEIVK
jgi:DUF4097 and DUF4098 domain-containing protein YvlB